MSGRILSSDEITALLQANAEESPYQILTDIFGHVAQKMIRPLQELAGGSVTMEGPYVESMNHSLAQVVTEEICLLPVETPRCELFVFMSTADATFLGKELGIPKKEAFYNLGKIWMKRLASVLEVLEEKNLRLQLFPVTILDLRALARLFVEENSILSRHLLRWNQRELEICFFIQGNQVRRLLQKNKGDRESAVSASVGKRLRSSTTRRQKSVQSPVTEAAFLPLDSVFPDPNDHPISLVEDINLPVIVELGHVVLTLNDLLRLKPHTIISLERHAGESVDVFINDNPVAKGEVVVLDEHFGVRILEIVPKSKRILVD